MAIDCYRRGNGSRATRRKMAGKTEANWMTSPQGMNSDLTPGHPRCKRHLHQSGTSRTGQRKVIERSHKGLYKGRGLPKSRLSWPRIRILGHLLNDFTDIFISESFFRSAIITRHNPNELVLFFCFLFFLFFVF